ncbi:MAG TPA: hypothetical protein PLK94_02995 [Alphaproteobacteria bacterium]|nr:hypothetical protein [Alphaproteobacteria bacterium]HOO50236.1 hypothetical protein [Alphaproteobacteria bacterium]
MAIYRQKLLFLLVFLSCASGFSGISKAYLRLDSIPELSYEITKSPEELDKLLEIHTEKPFGDESLAMEITLPIGWHRYETETVLDEKESSKENSFNGLTKRAYQIDKGGDIFRMLVRYSTPPRIQRRSEFRVRSIEINSLISLENWFTELILQMGFSPEGIKIVNRDRLEAQYTIFEYGEPMVTRAVVTRSGDKIIIAEFMVHQENIAKEGDLQVYSMQKFKMLSPEIDLPIALNVYPFVDIAKFNYPQNWILYTPGITTIDRMDASIINLRGMSDTSNATYDTMQMNGRVDVTVVYKSPDVTVASEMGIIGQSLKDNGLVLSEKIENSEKFKVNKNISKSAVTIYHIIPPASEQLKTNKFSYSSREKSKKLADYEYWIGTLETSGRYYFVRLLTIGRDEDFRAWAENTEVFKVLLESIAPVNDDIH